MKTMTINGNTITIDRGAVTINNELCGRADNYLKFGYHPVVKVSVKDKFTLLEMDELGSGLENVFIEAEKLYSN